MSLRNSATWLSTATVLTAWLQIGCSEQKVETYNTPPGVEIQEPSDGASFEYGDPVDFQGIVTDEEEDLDLLAIKWESNQDGVLDEEPADSVGFIRYVSGVLQPGSHIIILSATDGEGQTSETEIEVRVGEDPDGSGDGWGEDTGGADGTPPTVQLDAPANGDVFVAGTVVYVVGAVADADEFASGLYVTLTSSLDGLLWEGNPDDAGVVTVEVTDLSLGDHELTLSATDADGLRGTASAGIQVIADANPVVTITSPGDGDYYWLSDTITLSGEIVDDRTAGEDLAVMWVSSVDGNLHSGLANSAGVTSVTTMLSPGVHDILLRALDEDGNEGIGVVNVEIRDPLDHDGDLDGYTENEGDCNDTDPYIHPGAAEVCDDIDNNCNGQVNETYWDSQETSDSLADAIDAGTVDGSIIVDVDEWRMSGLTIHAADDEDWIKFDADDDIYDNVSVQVTVGLLPTGGNYLVELYLTDESTSVPVDSANGSGNLIVRYEGSPWDGGEDDFAIRVTPLSWLAGSCSDAYSVTIVN